MQDVEEKPDEAILVSEHEVFEGSIVALRDLQH
jgi:hypothetical protein